MYKKGISGLITFILLMVISSSCYDTRKSTYFNDIKNEAVYTSYDNNSEHIIQKNDQLSIYVTSLNEDASRPFNLVNGTLTSVSSVSGISTQTSGYLVDSDGMIQIHMLGSIKAEGLTKNQLQETIAKALTDKKYLVNPMVEVKYLNYEVTIIGEVTRPMVITVPSEKISLLKALGVAGDITAFGKKDNVMLIREVGGKKIVKRLDLNSGKFLQSPYYYLQPNDVVYIEANKNKEAGVSRNRVILPAIISSLSVLILAIDRIVHK